jgi:cell division protein FtsA
VGGDHFTNDLAVGLRTPIPDAERLKRAHGCALSTMADESKTIEVPSVGGRKARLLTLQVLAEILEPRATEIFTLIREELTRAGFSRALNAGVVLTGGGGVLPGVLEVAEQVFDLPVRLGAPRGAEGLAAGAAAPQHATAVGLALYAARHRPPRARLSLGVPIGGLSRMGDRFRQWFTEIF